MPPCVAHRIQWGILLFFLILLSFWSARCLASSSPQQQQQQERRDGAAHDNPSCKVQFAESYFATIATTVPIAGHYPPLAQTGHLYVDQTTGAVRIDQFFRNHRTTFLLDNRKLRSFLFFGERDFHRTSTAAAAAAATRDGGANNIDGDANSSSANAEVHQHCHVFYLPRKVSPFCVPQGYRVDSQPSLIRGVAATRFEGMEGYPGMPLIEQSLYVINMTSTASSSAAAVNASDALPAMAFAPWRLEYRARPDLEPHKIAAAPYTLPNWRFFGLPMFDEVTLFNAQENKLQVWQPVVDLMTIDFYDYYEIEHDDDTFAVPPQCTAVLRRGSTSGSDGSDGTGQSRRRKGKADGIETEEDNSSKDSESSGDAGRQGGVLPQLQLATIQRFLLQWHLLENLSVATIAEERATT